MNVYALVGGNIVFALCMCILNQLKIRKVCGYKIDLIRTFVKPFIAAAVMGVVTYAVHLVLDLVIGGRFIVTAISIIVAVAVYAVVVLRIGTLSEQDIKDLPMGVRLLRYCKKIPSASGRASRGRVKE